MVSFPSSRPFESRFGPNRFIEGPETTHVIVRWTRRAYPTQVWIKQTDAKGNVYYFNQDTLESAWFPPCMVCMRLEAKKVCFSCPDAGADGLFYCNECFEKSHDEDAVNEHNWRGADQDKEELKSGEKHCLVCGKAKATLVCKVCRDEYCEKCFAETHSHGQLKEHPTIPYLEAKQGWQKMVGRVAGEQTYYYNVSTGETRYDKPEEFMLEDELREHHNFLKFQLAAETHAKKVGELQVEVERLQSVWKSTSESGSRYVGTAVI